MFTAAPFSVIPSLFVNYIFKEYNIEDKPVNQQSKSRISIIVKKGIHYSRCVHLENKNNSTIVLKFKESRCKDIFVVGSYREWGHAPLR